MNALDCLHENDEGLSYMTAPLDSRQMRMFCWLACTGSCTQPALEVRLTQSAGSHSMKALESDAGCRLLHRLGKKIALTQAGGQLFFPPPKNFSGKENE